MALRPALREGDAESEGERRGEGEKEPLGVVDLLRGGDAESVPAWDAENVGKEKRAEGEGAPPEGEAKGEPVAPLCEAGGLPLPVALPRAVAEGEPEGVSAAPGECVGLALVDAVGAPLALSAPDCEGSSGLPLGLPASLSLARGDAVPLGLPALLPLARGDAE